MMRAYKNRRDASEPAIVKALEQLGCDVVRMDKPADLLVGLMGRNWLVECKTPNTHYGKKLNKNQIAFNQTWRGGLIETLTSPEDAVHFVNLVRRGM